MLQAPCAPPVDLVSVLHEDRRLSNAVYDKFSAHVSLIHFQACEARIWLFILLVQNVNMREQSFLFRKKLMLYTWESAYMPLGDALLVLYNHHINTLCGCLHNYIPLSTWLVCPGSKVPRVRISTCVIAALRKSRVHHLETKESKENVVSRSVTPIPSRPTTPKPPNGPDQFRSGMLTIKIFSGWFATS